MDPRLVFLAALTLAALTAGVVLWTEPVQPSGVFALLLTAPFLIIARVAWRRQRAMP